ncbi:hypothetical protein D3C75_937250 [compost metagenome]
MHFLPVQMRVTQRFQHRDRRPAGEANPDVVDLITQVVFGQHRQHPRAGANANGIVSVDKPLAAVAVHPGAVGEMFIQRVLDGVKRQRRRHQPGTPGHDRRTRSKSLFRPAVLAGDGHFAAGVFFHDRRHQLRVCF